MNKYFFIVLPFLVTYGKAQNISTFKEVENNIRQALYKKGFITQREYSENKGFSIYGTYQRKVDKKKMREGIYDVNLGNHRPKFNFIYEDYKVTFLDVNSFENFLESLRIEMIYLLKKGYCREITLDYVKRLIRTHYSFNRNPRDLINKNCEFPEERILSTFNLNDIYRKIAIEIAQKEDLIKANLQVEKIENIAVSKVSVYFGLKENEKLEDGIYSYHIENSDVFNKNYIIVNGNDSKFLKINSEESFINSLQEIILFGEKKNICSEKTIWYVEQLFSNYMEDSCFSEITSDLP